MNIDAHAWVDAGHHRVRTGRYIEEDFGAEFFDDLDDNIEAELDGIGRRGHVQILEADSKNDFLSGIAPEPAGAFSRNLDLHPGVCGPDLSVGLIHLNRGK